MVDKQLAALLTQFLQEYNEPFHWVSCNCAHTANAWLSLARGRPHDYIAGIDLTNGVLSALRSFGGNLAKAVTEQLGQAPIPLTLSSIGDIVFMPREGAAGILGICTGVRVACRHPQEGFVSMPINYDDSLGAAWRVRP